MEPEYARPTLRLLPSPTPESETFWTGGQQGKLLISRCRSCWHFFHPPGPSCWRCRSTDIAPEPVSGRARIAAYTVNHQPWIPGFEPPYVVAMVELVEEPDVRLTTNIVGIPPKDVRVGLDVEVFFEDWATMPGDKNSKVWIPLFRPSVGAS
ncbi:DNA-binding protein [Mycobacterium colombiense]|nr:OB-fold domain-containing protein [Mycobacterium colombiense]OBK63264.1 DNA-binding protein [Mycobacterium colombiense]